MILQIFQTLSTELTMFLFPFNIYFNQYQIVHAHQSHYSEGIHNYEMNIGILVNQCFQFHRESCVICKTMTNYLWLFYTIDVAIRKKIVIYWRMNSNNSSCIMHHSSYRIPFHSHYHTFDKQKQIAYEYIRLYKSFTQHRNSVLLFIFSLSLSPPT